MFLSKFLRLTSFLVLILVALSSLAQRGAIVQPASLADLTDRAQTIVRASVVNARVEPHPQLTNLQTVVLTLAVREAYKGNPSSTLTIRQFVWDIRDKMDAMGYNKGQEYILFLNPTTRYGLTSTTGLDQGRFRISTDSAGREVVENSVHNYGLLSGTDPIPWAAVDSSTSRQTTSHSQMAPSSSAAAISSGASREIPVTDFVKAIKSRIPNK